MKYLYLLLMHITFLIIVSCSSKKVYYYKDRDFYSQIELCKNHTMSEFSTGIYGTDTLYGTWMKKNKDIIISYTTPVFFRDLSKYKTIQIEEKQNEKDSLFIYIINPYKESNILFNIGGNPTVISVYLNNNINSPCIAKPIKNNLYKAICKNNNPKQLVIYFGMSGFHLSYKPFDSEANMFFFKIYLPDKMRKILQTKTKFYFDPINKYKQSLFRLCYYDSIQQKKYCYKRRLFFKPILNCKSLK